MELYMTSHSVLIMTTFGQMNASTQASSRFRRLLRRQAPCKRLDVPVLHNSAKACPTSRADIN